MGFNSKDTRLVQFLKINVIHYSNRPKVEKSHDHINDEEKALGKIQLSSIVLKKVFYRLTDLECSRVVAKGRRYKFGGWG